MQHRARPPVGRHRAPRAAPSPTGRHRAPRRRPGGRRAPTALAAAVVATAAAVGMAEWPTDRSQAATRPAATAADPVERSLPTSSPEPLVRAEREAPASRSAVRRTVRDAEPDEPGWLTECGSRPEVSAGNGLVPDEQLCELPGTGGQHLTPAAARAWWSLDQRFRDRFGQPPCITDSYRTLAQQQSLYATKPGLAATPGTSNHGWATALDLCGGVESFDTAEHQWLADNASRWGWVNPSWAQRYGSRPEPWHWELVAD